MKNYQGKIAVITGAASGIGKALAFKCAQEGMQIVLADVNENALAEVTSELQANGAIALSVKTDVTQVAEVKHLLRQTLTLGNHIELLFNNAGIVGPLGPIWAIPLSAFQKMLDINLQGIVAVLQEFVPHLLNQEVSSHIVNTSAMSGLFTYPYFSGYQISKHAIIALSECLYHDLKTRNSAIKVSVLCPGWVKTNISSGIKEFDLDAYLPEDYLGPEDMKWLVAYAKLIKNGMQASQLADLTFEALRQNKFYIFTHPEMKPPIAQRFQAILNETEPAEFEVT